jgi:hypothetical protein
VSACTYNNYSARGIWEALIEAYPVGRGNTTKEHCMGDIKADEDNVPADKSGESTLRGSALDGSEQEKSVAHTAFEKTRNTDSTLRLDGEEDTLYEDGLEVEDGSGPLTGKDGRDDTDNPA